LIRGGEPNQSLFLVLSGHFGVHLALDQDPIAELKAACWCWMKRPYGLFLSLHRWRAIFYC